MFALAAPLTQSAQAQTYQVIHQFTGGTDGANPQDGLAIDRAGNLYGVTQYGGQQSMCPSSAHAPGCGVVFRLKPSGSGWSLTPLYTFLNDGSGGRWPYGRLIFGLDGALYGTTTAGGTNGGEGTVFKLAPPVTACKTALCPWTETILHSFGDDDGLQPQDIGGLIFDSAGNLYGSTVYGGGGRGIVFELTPANGIWTEQVLYDFAADGGTGPTGGVVLDQAGNIYGTIAACDPNCSGTVFQLTPSESGWTQNVLHSFSGNDGEDPVAGLIMDGAGNLYGSTLAGTYGATIFELTPSAGNWTFSVIAYVAGGIGLGPEGNLVMDSLGNLYGTTYRGGTFNQGNVFKLTPTGGGWMYTDLYDFTGGNDGSNPRSNVVIDAKGNLYGTASECGYSCAPDKYGVVWEITP